MSKFFEQWNACPHNEEKALHEEADFWRLTGYAATYDQDRVNDVIVPGAFKKCLERMNQKGESLQLYFNHDLAAPPIGSVESVTEDRKGLRFEAHLPKDDTFVSSRIVPQIKRRSIKSNSFGYRVRQSERRKSDNVRLLREIDIMEISVVNNPANPAANIENIKGLVGFLDLPIDTRATSYDPEAALKRLQAHFGCEHGPSDEFKSAFLYVDMDRADEWDAYRLPIADVDEKGCVIANRVAIHKAVAALCGARKESLPEEAEYAVRETLERYYAKMNLEPPFKSLSVSEWKALDVGERKARLQYGVSLSRALAAELASLQPSGQRAADRNPSQTNVGSTEEATKLLTALTDALKGFSAVAINPAPKD